MIEIDSFFKRHAVPIVRQTETTECGLACLVMCMSFWKYQTDLSTLRKSHSNGGRGTTLKTLMDIAGKAGFQTRAIKIQLDEIVRLKMPAILHWDTQHFVVLVWVRGGNACIHDPARGKVVMPVEELSKHFTGIAFELLPGLEFAPGKHGTTVSLGRLMGSVRGLKLGLANILALGVVMQCLSLVVPFYMQMVVDNAMATDDRNLLQALGLGFAFLLVIQTFISVARSWAVVALSSDLNFQWQGNVFAHLLRLPIHYFERRRLGDIFTRFDSLQVIQRTVTSQSVEAVIDGVLVLVTLVAMFWYSAQLSWITIAVTLTFGLLRAALLSRMRALTQGKISATAQQGTHMIESIRGIQSLRLHNKVDDRRNNWVNMLAQQFNADISLNKLAIFQKAAQSLFTGLEYTFLVWAGATLVMGNEMSIGMLLAFLAYRAAFSERVMSLYDKALEFGMLKVHNERVADIVLHEPVSHDMAGIVDTRLLNYTVELRDVSFAYGAHDKPILDGINLKIEAGEFVAIAGASGSGKTTLLKIILGLLEPTQGEVLIGGVPIKHFGLANYRDLCSTVMQDDQLFSGSIAENVSMFEPTISYERLIDAVKAAAIHDEVRCMPMAFATVVGDQGAGLSGGQRQRLLLARALYRQPKLLVLDEATSHLDASNEAKVNEAIQARAITRLIVAHRQETLAKAQRVLHLINGKLQ
jgi:ATP-binding cassette, subfamily B, bacterial CvaB/MchF/RaxB